MKRFRCKFLLSAAFITTFLLLPVTAFAATPGNTAAHVSVKLSHPVYRLLAGQEKIISFPTKDDPKAQLHLQLRVRKLAATAVSPNSSGCIDNVAATQRISNVYGGTLASYTIELDFCYGGNHVTYITDPPNESWNTCCLWGIGSHNSYIRVYPNTALGHGDFTFNGPVWQSWSGWNEIDVTGSGGYSASYG